MSFWGHSEHLRFLRKYDFQNAASAFILQPNRDHPWGPCTQKFIGILNLKKKTRKNKLKFSIVTNGKMKNGKDLASRGENGVKFGTRGGGTSGTYMGYLWPHSVQGHYGVIRCNCNFSKNTIFTIYVYVLFPTFIMAVPCDRPHNKRDFLEVWNLKFKTFE